MAELPSVSVMFVTRGRPQMIHRALTAVLDDPATSEAIVVIDGEDPETTELLTTIGDSRIRVTHTPPAGPDGLDSTQRGRDHGAGLASSDVVLALDDDVIAGPGLVSGHARHHTGDDGRLLVLGYMPVATRIHWPRSSAPVRIYSATYEQHCDEFEADPGSILKRLWGGNLSLRRGDWLDAIEAGRVPCYQEDKEFGLLLARQGFRAIFDRDLRGNHLYDRDLRGFVRRAEMTPPSQAALRAAYADVIEDQAWIDLPQHPIIKALIRPSGSSVGWFAIRWMLIALASLAAALRLTRLEDRAAELLWRVASERRPASDFARGGVLR
jgi:hypothetical protein